MTALTIDEMPTADLATLLTDAINADVWTDAPECSMQIAAIQDAMAEAAHRLVPATDAEAVADARAMYADDEVRVDDGAPVIATDSGKWVQAWVFVEN